MMIIKVIAIAALLFIHATTCPAQIAADTLYSYDIFSGAFTKEEMNKKYYSPMYSLGHYDTKTGKLADSVSVTIDFKTHGCMSFQKYYNEMLYLEGAYNSSDTSEMLEGHAIDPITGELLKPEWRRYYHPTKCGVWNFYLNGKIREQITFEKCKCQ